MWQFSTWKKQTPKLSGSMCLRNKSVEQESVHTHTQSFGVTVTQIWLRTFQRTGFQRGVTLDLFVDRSPDESHTVPSSHFSYDKLEDRSVHAPRTNTERYERSRARVAQLCAQTQQSHVLVRFWDKSLRFPTTKKKKEPSGVLQKKCAGVKQRHRLSS